MLLSFRVENHKSIRDEQQLLLAPVYDDARPQEADWEATTVAGIFGANASGKSNILDALSFMRDTVRWSFRDNEPGKGFRRFAFGLDMESEAEPSTFVVDLKLDGERYTYGFAVDDDHVVEEWLYHYPKQRKRVVFERESGTFTFGDSMSAGLRQVAGITGRNVLFLTVAAHSEQEEVVPVHRWFADHVVFASERRPELPEWLRAGSVSPDQMRALSDLLRSAGTGVHQIELVDDQDMPPELGLAPPDTTGPVVFNLTKPSARKFRTIRYLAEMGSGKAHAYAHLLEMMRGGLYFHHEGGTAARPFSRQEESLGTRALTVIGFEAQRVLATGGVFVVDEIDASLHPYLSARVIALFHDEEQNPKGAQLIFTSHDAALLGRVRGEDVLKRDHIWFVDKDDEGRTSLYPLSDFKPRGDDNRARRYLTGRYGAVPDVDDELFRDALRRREQEPEEATR